MFSVLFYDRDHAYVTVVFNSNYKLCHYKVYNIKLYFGTFYLNFLSVEAIRANYTMQSSSSEASNLYSDINSTL